MVRSGFPNTIIEPEGVATISVFVLIAKLETGGVSDWGKGEVERRTYPLLIVCYCFTWLVEQEGDWDFGHSVGAW